MFPSSLLGLALFVLLLAPGLGYVLRRERTVPARTYSAFRETVLVVAVSLLCLTGAGLLFAAARWLWPKHTLNFRGLVHDPATFARTHHVQLIWWSLVFLCLAVLLGLAAADPRINRLAASAVRRRPFRWLIAPADTDIKRASAWYIVMHMYDHDPGPIDVGAQLDDGSYVRGRLSHLNVAAAETADRDLLLESPLELVTADGKGVELKWQYVVVSARRIVRLDVTHLPPPVSDSVIPVQDRGDARTDELRSSKHLSLI